MKAMTLYEPWASFIAYGLKTIETRTHDRFRCLVGQRIAIHAGLGFDSIANALAREACEYAGRIWAPPGGIYRRHGQVVCTAEVFAARWCTPADIGDALCDTTAKFGLFLRKIDGQADCTKIRGHQGIWEWTPPNEAGDQPTPAQIAAAQRIPRALAEPDNRTRRRRHHYPPSRRRT